MRAETHVEIQKGVITLNVLMLINDGFAEAPRSVDRCASLQNAI